jgi:hypothetical protein
MWFLQTYCISEHLYIYYAFLIPHLHLPIFHFQGDRHDILFTVVYAFQKHMEDVWCNSFSAQFEIVRFNRSWTVMHMFVWGTCFDFVPIRFWNCCDSAVFPILFDIQVYTSICH